MSNLTDFFPSGGGGLTPKFEEFNASGTFTPSQALIDAGGYIEVFLVAGGGSGASRTVGPGGADGGEAFLKKMYLTSTNNVAVTVGAGGAFTGNTSLGNTGGNSSFNGSTAGGIDLTANGGDGATSSSGSSRSSSLSPSWGSYNDGSDRTASAGPGVFGYGAGGSMGSLYYGSSRTITPNSGQGGYSQNNGTGTSGGSGYCLIKWYE